MPTRKIMNPFDWFSAYIVSTSSGITMLPLPTIPESVSDQLSLNTYEQAIVGRSAPIISYVNTGARQVNFTIALADDYMPTNESGTQYTITEYVAALKSLVYPEYGSKINAPNITCKIGNIKISGICTGVNVTWKGPLSNVIAGGCFSRCDVQISIKEVRATVRGATYIKGGGSDK